MAAPSRAKQLSRLHNTLKRKYRPRLPSDERTVLEYLILGVCLENATLAPAEAALKRLDSEFYDWNEVRVSTVGELQKVLDDLPDTEQKALRIRSVLHDVFETYYQFDLEDLRRKPLGQAQKVLNKLDGADPFVVAFTVQGTLGGHAIPTDDRLHDCLTRLGLAEAQDSPAELASRLERWIPKARGREFCWLLRRLSTELDRRKDPPVFRTLRSSLFPGGLPKRTTASTRTQTSAGSKAKTGRKKAAPRTRSKTAARRK